MGNNIPVFELGKDSYILKHKLNYNTSYEGELSAITYGILFTDYNLARKTQSTNAINFKPVVIDLPIDDIVSFQYTYYDKEYEFELSNRWKYDNLVSGTTSKSTNISDLISSGATFINNRDYQAYYIPSIYTPLFQTNDYFNIYFHEIIPNTTGNTTWEHFGAAGEIWVTTGLTSNNIPWQVTGITTEDGQTSGITIWTVTDYVPIGRYQVKVLEVGSNYIKVERKLEDYIYNNIMKIASDTNYQYLYYSLESLKFTDKSYYGIKYILEESEWSNYFSIISTSDSITIQPISNDDDLYFDYDNVQIILNITGSTQQTFKFETDNLYTKYKLDRFLSQFGYDENTNIYFNHLSYTNSTGSTYNGGNEFNIELLNSGDTEYFSEYTYVYASGLTTSGNTVEHICLILDISGTTFTLLTPKVNLLLGEKIICINNMYTIHDISKMLYECYINIENNS